MLETDGKATDCYPYPLHLSTAGDSINRLRPLVKFQPVRLVNFRPAPTAYTRYSSDNQREASILDQLRNIETYCERLGWPRPQHYQDQAISGSRNDRPGYQSMILEAERGRIDVLLVDDLTRLSRDHIETAQTIRRLKHYGVRIIGVTDGTDTDRDSYKLETGLRGLMSEYYLDDLAKKTHRGLTGQALSGYSAGGLPYGYSSQHDGQGFLRVINLEQAKWVCYIYQQYANGHTPRQIASDLNQKCIPSPRGQSWSHSAIYPDSRGIGILGNPIYNGKQVWNRSQWTKDPTTGRRRRTERPPTDWIITYHQELQIIDDDLWRAVQARKIAQHRTTQQQKETGKNSGGRTSKYLLSGLLKCGQCGKPYTIQGRTHYGCSGHKNQGESICTNKLTVKRATLENVLLIDIKKTLLSETAYQTFLDELKNLIAQTKPDTSHIKRNLAQAKTELENIMSAIKAGIITPTTKTALIEAENKIGQFQAELKDVEQIDHSKILLQSRKIYQEIVEKLEAIEDTVSAREALRALVGEIKLIPENGTLTAEIENAGLAGVLQISVVAGAGFEPTTFGL